MFVVLAEPVATVTSPAHTATITDDALKHWTALRPDDALSFLIKAAWTEGEAKERGIAVTGAQLREHAEPADALSRADELYLARVHVLETRIRDQVTQAAAQSVTAQQIEDYVQTHPRLDPEQRRARVLQARSRAAAKRARSAIARGLTWRSAARRYGTSAQRTIVDSPQAGRLEQAVLRADRGDTTRYGAYVFRVSRITPARPAPLAVQRAQAWEILSSETQQQALNAFATALIEKWRPRTLCAPSYATHESCGNPPTGE